MWEWHVTCRWQVYLRANYEWRTVPNSVYNTVLFSLPVATHASSDSLPLSLDQIFAYVACLARCSTHLVSHLGWPPSSGSLFKLGFFWLSHVYRAVSVHTPDLYVNTHTSSTHNPRLETTKSSMKTWMSEETVVYSHRAVSLSNKK